MRELILGTIDIPDCAAPAYAHWYEIGAWQMTIFLLTVLFLICLTVVIVNGQDKRQKRQEDAADRLELGPVKGFGQ